MQSLASRRLDKRLQAEIRAQLLEVRASRARIVEAAELADVDPAFQTLRNVNTPEEYEAALRELG